MKKLIELDAALDALMIAKTVETSVTGYASNAGVDWCIDTIKALQTVDAVEVVRCKDCKHKHYYQFPPKYDIRSYCDEHEKVVTEHDFCSRGKRKDGEQP